MKTFQVIASSPPQVQQGPKLVGEGAVGGANQGVSVAISADGRTVIVGGYLDNESIGASWVWFFDGSRWVSQSGKLVGVDHSGQSRQGQRVALTASGDLAVVSGPSDEAQNGAIWTFVRDGAGSWQQSGPKLVHKGLGFGWFIAISADGSTLVSSAQLLNTNSKMDILVFRREADRWQFQQILERHGDGYSYDADVAISSDGKVILVGDPNVFEGVGAAWVFIKDLYGVWPTGVRLDAKDLAGQPRQGRSVGLSADGRTAIVGAPFDDRGRGAVWVFTHESNGWQQQGNKLFVDGGALGGLFGNSVSLSADGSLALVGAMADDNTKGAAWLWRRTGTVWTLYGEKLSGTDFVGGAQQGYSVALSSDGGSAVVGGPGDDTAGQYASGAAWIFGPKLATLPPPEIDDFTPASGAIGTLVTIKGRHFDDLISVSIGGVNALPISNDGNTLVVMVMPGATSGPLTVTTSGGTVTA